METLIADSWEDLQNKLFMDSWNDIWVASVPEWLFAACPMSPTGWKPP